MRVFVPPVKAGTIKYYILILFVVGMALKWSVARPATFSQNNESTESTHAHEDLHERTQGRY